MARRHLVLVLGLLVAVGTSGCGSPRIPSVEPPADPIVRYPYVQAVTDSSAQIRWTTSRPGPDTLVYWLESGESTPDTLRAPSAGNGNRHAVTLAPLPAGAIVGFRLIASPVATRTHRFRTAPPRGTGANGSNGSNGSNDSADPSSTSSAEVTVLVFGDSGLGSDAQLELADRMEEWAPDLVLHTGDVAYPDGTAFDLTHRHFRVYQDLLAEAPFYPAPGNHDVRTEEGRPFHRAFRLPGSPTGSSGFYGSFDWGGIHFIVLDSTHEPGGSPDEDLRRGHPGEAGDPGGADAGSADAGSADAGSANAGGADAGGADAGSADAGGADAGGADAGRDGPGRGQYAWLTRDLRTTSADPSTEWIVVVLHHPPFSSGGGLVGHGSDDDLRRVLTPLFDRYGVDLVLTGHDHHYERSHPIRSGRIDSATPGTVYVVTGGGGGSLLWRAVGREWHTAKAVFEHHFVTLEVVDGRMLLTAVGRDGRLLDEYEVRPVPPSGE